MIARVACVAVLAASCVATSPAKASCADLLDLSIPDSDASCNDACGAFVSGNATRMDLKTLAKCVKKYGSCELTIEDIIAGCQERMHSTLPDWQEDCAEKCRFYATGSGTAWCGVPTSIEELITCVVEYNEDHCSVSEKKAAARDAAKPKFASSVSEKKKAAARDAVKPKASSVDGYIAACQDMMSSSLPEWLEDCVDKCEFYATGAGTAWCGVPESADALADCVVKYHSDHCVKTKTTIETIIAECQAAMTSSIPEWQQDCVDKCEFYAKGAGTAWCGVPESADDLIECVLKQHPDHCARA